MRTIGDFAEIEHEFVQRAHAAVWCNVATVDSQGRPRSRVLHPIWEGATGWIATGPNTLKGKHLAANPFVSLAYIADPFKPVYAECRATWEGDAAAKQRVWDLFKGAPEPLGYDPGLIWPSASAPSFGVLRLAPWLVELYDLVHQENSRVWRA